MCGQAIAEGEPCERSTGVEAGEGWWTMHCHPECLDLTVTQKWDANEWENAYWESETERPTEKRTCFMCRKEATAWIALEVRPRYVCSAFCLDNYVNARDLT